MKLLLAGDAAPARTSTPTIEIVQSSQTDRQPRFDAPAGTFLGVGRAGVHQALGIRYARAERFQPPVAEPDAAAQVSATRPAPACPQVDGGGGAAEYLMSWGGRGNRFRGCHAIDIPLLFPGDLWDGAPVVGRMTPEQVESDGRLVRRLWADFARTGSVPDLDAPGIIRTRRHDRRAA